nr:hypothetical protein [Proteus mirabilis]
MALIFAYLGFINNQWLSIYSQHCANALLSLFVIVVFLADEHPFNPPHKSSKQILHFLVSFL